MYKDDSIQIPKSAYDIAREYIDINFQKKVIKTELEISKPLYIDLNEIQ